ncbi:N-acetylmuramate alpha-1-phosphate uridylyltransferase MurU [Pseudocolwellia agarivorans]|uniref:N-acetylmuramate alpha-1-phosphate uridylyltransferase MurU n=1 Tax=Pseudocolwellia agarivorans TaxID=1911682 RepID=UPI000986D6C0|nr:nucleotidyltransferase family protein [Pseudocolwellia agarivorans]
MKAMILAAGRGERMRPLTDDCPKPLLKVAGIPLIEHHIVKLAQAGITDIVINHAWLGYKIEEYLQDGSQWGVSIRYSRETQGALETAGGIIKALPLLVEKDEPNAPFLVVNGDVYTDFDFTHIPLLPSDCLANIWLVANPEHNLKGDFLLAEEASTLNKSNKVYNLTSKENQPLQHQAYTFSGIALYKPEFFTAHSHDAAILPLGPLLRETAENLELSGTILKGQWTDVGTPERLNELNKIIPC